jgi:hypothetical protein
MHKQERKPMSMIGTAVNSLDQLDYVYDPKAVRRSNQPRAKAPQGQSAVSP